MTKVSRKLLCLLVFIYAALFSGCTQNRPNVILVIIDTLRADHLGFYGYERNTSPCLDSLAAEGTTWMNTRAQASWTLPATASILTGRSVKSHGVTMNVSQERIFGMNSQLPTIATILHGEKYTSAAFFNIFLMSETFGYHRGFDHFQCNPEGHGLAGETVDNAITWLNQSGKDEPFFLALHFFDPHDPYSPPAPFDTLWSGEKLEDSVWTFTPDGAIANPQQKDNLIALYDGEIAWTDQQLSRLFSELRDRGIADNTIVIVTADHGEEFLEHGYGGHGKTLFDEILRVPFIMSGYGIPVGQRIDYPAAQMDILPTILGRINIDSPQDLSDFDGIDLFAENLPPSRRIPSSDVNTGPPFLTAAVTSDFVKTIWYPEYDTFRSYNLISDPAETTHIVPDSLQMEMVLNYWVTPPAYPGIEVVGMEIGPALRDLGYL